MIINALYHSGVNAIISTAYIMIGKKFLRMHSPDAGKFSIEDTGMIALSVAAGDLTREYMVRMKWIPENVNV